MGWDRLLWPSGSNSRAAIYANTRCRVPMEANPGKHRQELEADTPTSRGPPCPPGQGPSSPEGPQAEALLGNLGQGPKAQTYGQTCKERLRALGIRSGAALPFPMSPRAPGEPRTSLPRDPR